MHSKQQLWWTGGTCRRLWLYCLARAWLWVVGGGEAVMRGIQARAMRDAWRRLHTYRIDTGAVRCAHPAALAPHRRARQTATSLLSIYNHPPSTNHPTLPLSISFLRSSHSTFALHNQPHSTFSRLRSPALLVEVLPRPCTPHHPHVCTSGFCPRTHDSILGAGWGRLRRLPRCRSPQQAHRR